MGQRHQVFAIARIRPYSYSGKDLPEYRCVAALHHQWCYGRLPAKAMRRCLTLVKQKDNAEVIRAELRNLDGKYGKWNQSPSLPEVPCPYIAFLLGAAYSTDLGNPAAFYSSNVILLEADMGSSEGDNNDGISIIDVTDPTEPSYCFVSLGGMESEADTPVWTPLSAEEYVRAYYAKPSATDLQKEGKDGDMIRLTEQDVANVIADLQDEKVAKRKMLEEAWPGEYLRGSRRKGHQEQEPETSEGSSSSGLPALANLALGPSVSQCLEDGDFSEIEHLLDMPGRADIVYSMLRTMTPFPDSAVSLLLKTLPQDAVAEGRLDLSGIGMSHEQILTLVSSSESPITSLNLSFNPNVSVETLRGLFSAAPRLRRLVLMGCPGVSDQDLTSFLRSESHLLKNIDALIHPSFLSFSPAPLNGLSLVHVTNGRDIVGATMPYFTPASAVQNITDYLQVFASPDADMIDMMHSWMPTATFCAGARKDGQKWGERSVVFIPSFSRAGYRGEGWVFAFNYSVGMFSSPQVHKSWGFVKFGLEEVVQPPRTESENTASSDQEPDASPPKPTPRQFQHTWKIHDLDSFLNVVSDGRDSAPLESVEKLQDILFKLKKEQNCHVMNDTDAQKHVETALGHTRFRRVGE